MLELCQNAKNAWVPPLISERDKENMCREKGESFVIFKTEPYIDAHYFDPATSYAKRFSFHEDYRWSYADEQFFKEKCLQNDRIWFDSGVLDSVFEYYSEKYPDWKLRRYYTKPMRLLDHIYHCMRRESAKEMLYKAGLDELAVHIDELDEIDLMSSRPSDLYGGISMRVLRALNCNEGANLLSTEYNRKFMKDLQMKFPRIFEEKLNDSQCRYLSYLIEGELTVGEAGRLFDARRKQLKGMWAPTQYQMFIQKEKQGQEIKELEAIDPIYRDYIEKRIPEQDDRNKLQILKYYLLRQREKYDILFRRSNRKRNSDWEERNNGYVVRYPQTINDFCRESIYMSNCLMTYVDAYINNDTTILLMRKTDNFNEPFITIEIYDNTLMQAYHRFNTDCTAEEARWILDYCKRHGIDTGHFTFDRNIDVLF